MWLFDVMKMRVYCVCDDEDEGCHGWLLPRQVVGWGKMMMGRKVGGYDLG